MNARVLGVVLAGALAAAAPAQDKKAPPLKETLAKLLGGMGAEKIGDRRGP